MPTVRKTIKALISRAAVSLASTFITAALTTYGVINVSAARWELFFAGLVIVGAATTSDYLCDKSWKHVLAVFVLSIVLTGSCLLYVDQWATGKRAETDARSTPPQGPIFKLPSAPPFAFYKTPVRPQSPVNHVVGNNNIVGNAVTQALVEFLKSETEILSSFRNPSLPKMLRPVAL